jgi:hypothetical protein
VLEEVAAMLEGMKRTHHGQLGDELSGVALV